MTQWGRGRVGDAVEASTRERILRFIRDEESEALSLFGPAWRDTADDGGWYGEHVGKWLCTAAGVRGRMVSPEMEPALERVIAFLGSVQEESGYLGTYAPTSSCRFTSPKAETVRTWDLWIHAWLILGLLREGSTESQRIAIRIGNLLLETFGDGTRSVLDQGNHQGLSSAILIEPLARLTLATKDSRYASLATTIVEQMRERGMWSADDVSEIGTGKVYQICWVLVGLVALYQATGDKAALGLAERYAKSIGRYHVTPTGGPWGGIAGHKEVFNSPDYFSPYGMVETCSIVTWMALCRELFLVSGDEWYVEQFERSLLNSLVGALNENGSDWCYFTFPNGRRNNTYHWACCKSSGALGLEDAARLIATATADGVAINLFLPSRVELQVGDQRVDIQQEGLEIVVSSPATARFVVALRRPNWGVVRGVRVNGDLVEVTNGPYLQIEREWGSRDVIEYDLEMPIRVHAFTHSVDHHGQEVVRTDYACVSKGPLVYATGLIDGFRKEETLRLPRLNPATAFRDLGGDRLELRLPGRDPIPFAPYAEAGGRHDGAWRTTWLQVAWQ